MIDIDTCVQMCMIKDLDGRKEKFQILVGKKNSILLPDPTRTNTRIPESWLYVEIVQ